MTTTIIMSALLIFAMIILPVYMMIVRFKRYEIRKKVYAKRNKKDLKSKKSEFEKMLLLGYAHMKKEEFKKNEVREFSKLLPEFIKENDFSIIALTEKGCKIRIKKYLFETVSENFPIYEVEKNNKKENFFIFEDVEIKKFIEK